MVRALKKTPVTQNPGISYSKTILMEQIRLAPLFSFRSQDLDTVEPIVPEEKTFVHSAVWAKFEVADQGTIAQIRAGEPEPSFNLRGLTINVAPFAGSWSRFAIFSM